MKYYHVIYTSSQKNLNGSNGFGIRTATEGTPQTYLQAVTNAVNTNIITNDTEGLKMPSPKELLEDGRCILSVPPRYFYLKLDVEGGSPIFAVGRNIELGFTELFYYKDKDGNISGKGGRTGNFLIDVYLFEERPQRDVFQIFKDNCFIPADPSPRVNNMEMASIATGEPVPFPVSEVWPLHEGSELPQERAVDLLFLLLEGRLSSLKKNVVVKYPWQQTHGLIADAMKLLPNNYVGDFTFSTNYGGNGYIVPAELNFVNEFYEAEFVGSDMFVDLTNYVPQTDESRAYRHIILDALKQGDLQTIRQLFGWMLSDSYERVRKLNPHTNKILFIYSQQPAQFNLAMLHENGNEDKELLEQLNRVINENPQANKHPFIDCLGNDLDMACSVEKVDENTPQDMALLINRIEMYAKYISITKDVVSKFSDHIEEVLLSNPLLAIDRLGINIVRKYTNNLENAIHREDLASFFFEQIKDNKPQTLQEAKDVIDKYQTTNPKVFDLLVTNFSLIFGGLYDQVVRDAANHSDKKSVANALDRNLLNPLQSAHDDSAFQKYEQLYEVLNETVEVDSNNFRDVLKLLKDTGMLTSSVAARVKEQLFKAGNERDIKESVNTLVEYWKLKYSDIIDQLPSNIDTPTKKLFVKSALEKNANLNINDVIRCLEDNNFGEDEIKGFLSQSSSFASAYNSLIRKNAIGNFFKGILNVFKKKENNSQEEEKTPSTAVEEGAVKKEKKKNSSSISTTSPVEKPVIDVNVLKGLLNNMEKPMYKSNGSSCLNDQQRKLHDQLRDIIEDCEASNKKIPDNLEEFKKLLSIWLLVFLFSMMSPINVFATGQNESNHSAYGYAKHAPTCYIVNTKTLNVRTSPSLYKGKRKKKRTDNLAFKMNKGDTVYINPSTLPQTVDKIEWISFSDGGRTYYTNLGSLLEISNPHYIHDDKVDVTITEGLLGFTKRAAPWMLLVFTVICFFITFGVVTPDKDSIRGEPRDSTGMRPMFMYSLRPYKFFAGLSLRVIIAGLASVFIVLAIGGAIWGVLWIVKIAMWILIILGWILLVGGFLACFANPIVGIIVAAIGGVIVYYEDTLKIFGDECVATGFAYLEALNVWDFSYELVKRFWFDALIISLIPIVLFLIAAVIMLIVAGILRAYDYITTKRYNIRHECPHCHRPLTEPVKYFDEKRGQGRIPLPCNLRPGIYGLLHITHPVTGTKLPTLLANGRDKLPRECPKCYQTSQFKSGTDKHIGFVGMPGAGKTVLLAGIIGEFKTRLKKQGLDFSFTGKTDKDLKDSVIFISEEGLLDDSHLPKKTRTNKMRASVQCVYPRLNADVPYVLYFNDVSGESFVTENYDKDLLLFSKDVESILFIVDPITMSLKMDEISSSLRDWLQRDDIQNMRNSKNKDINEICYSLINALRGSNRDIGSIHLIFVLVKSDLGYIKDIDPSNQESVRSFMESDMCLGNLIDNAESQFASVSYLAVSVFTKNDKGIRCLCDRLVEQLELK